MTAYDNRGVARTPLPAEPLSPATLADDAAAPEDFNARVEAFWQAVAARGSLAREAP